MSDNKQIKDGLGNLFTVRMRDYSTNGTLQKTMMNATLMPIEYGIGGVYGHCAKSGTLPNATAMTAAPLYSFFFPTGTATLYALVRRVRVSAWATGVFAAGLVTFDMYAARAFLVPDSGGLLANLAAYNNQLNTLMAPSRATIRIADYTALTPGTRTLDLAPLDRLVVNAPTVVPATFGIQRLPLFERHQGEHPLLLAPDEGFVVQVTAPAGGPWSFAVTTEWDEVQVF